MMAAINQKKGFFIFLFKTFLSKQTITSLRFRKE